MAHSGLSNLFHILARIAFGATVFLIPFRTRIILQARPLPPVFPDYTDLLLFASDILLIATLAFWVLDLVSRPRRINFGPAFLTLPLSGLAAFGIVSTIVSADASLSLYHPIRLLGLLAMYLFILNEIKSLGEIFVPIALQVFVQATTGIVQVLQQHSIGMQPIGELLLDPPWKGISTVWSGTAISLRAYGLTDHPNILGGGLAFALLLIAIWYASTPTTWRTLIAGLFGLGALALLLTFSRAAWLALGAGALLILALFFATRQMRMAVDWIALVFAAAIIVAPFALRYAGFLDARLNPNEPSMFTGQNRALAERNTLNVATIGIFAAHPIWGVGLGTVPLAMRAAYPSFPFDYQPAHFVLLEVAAETGFFGALVYLAVMLSPWIAMWLNRRRINFTPALVGISGVLLAVTLVGFFDYYTWLLVPGRLWQWLAWGLWGTVYTSSILGAADA